MDAVNNNIVQLPSVDSFALPQPRELGCVGQTIKCLVGPEDRSLVLKVVVYALTFFASTALILSLIGIPLFILGYKEFMLQQAEARYLPIIQKLGALADPEVEAKLEEYSEMKAVLAETQRELGALAVAYSKLDKRHGSVSRRYADKALSCETKETELQKLTKLNRDLKKTVKSLEDLASNAQTKFMTMKFTNSPVRDDIAEALKQAQEEINALKIQNGKLAEKANALQQLYSLNEATSAQKTLVADRESLKLAEQGVRLLEASLALDYNEMRS